MRVLYVGLAGGCSAPPLAALLAAGIEVCGLLLPAPAGAGLTRLAPPATLSHTIPLATPGQPAAPTLQLAWAHGIPAFATGRVRHSTTRATLAALTPDLACVVCFPWRIPVELLTLPRYGWWNMHPSLLPAYRGPAPLFWMLRHGERTGGVTIHQMDAEFDHGPIVAQEPFALADGMSGAAIDELWAKTGARLLVATIGQLRDGTLQAQPQPAGGSYYGMPGDADFDLDPAWPAERAFNFMRGTVEWGRPYSYAGHDLLVGAALDWDARRWLDVPVKYDGANVLLRFTPGIVQARLFDGQQP